MKSDSEIERDVQAELEWDPDLDAADIAVKVKSGVAELTGFARSYTDRYEAEIAAKRVAGVAKSRLRRVPPGQSPAARYSSTPSNSGTRA